MREGKVAENESLKLLGRERRLKAQLSLGLTFQSKTFVRFSIFRVENLSRKRLHETSGRKRFETQNLTLGSLGS